MTLREQPSNEVADIKGSACRKTLTQKEQFSNEVADIKGSACRKTLTQTERPSNEVADIKAQPAERHRLSLYLSSGSSFCVSWKISLYSYLDNMPYTLTPRVKCAYQHFSFKIFKIIVQHAHCEIRAQRTTGVNKPSSRKQKHCLQNISSYIQCS